MRQSTPLGDRIRMLAAPYAATGHRERAEGLIQAADLVDAEAALLTGKAMVEVLGQMIDERLEGFVADVVAALRSEADAAPPPEGPRRKGRRAPEPPAPPPPSPRAAREQKRFGTLVGALTMAHGERQVLVAICQHDPTPLQRDQLQALTGYTKRTVNNYLQALRRLRLVAKAGASTTVLTEHLVDAKARGAA